MFGLRLEKMNESCLQESGDYRCPLFFRRLSFLSKESEKLSDPKKRLCFQRESLLLAAADVFCYTRQKRPGRSQSVVYGAEAWILKGICSETDMKCFLDFRNLDRGLLLDFCPWGKQKRNLDRWKYQEPLALFLANKHHSPSPFTTRKCQPTCLKI